MKMDTIQALAAVITVSSATFYFITVLIKVYKMFKTNEVEIKKEVKEKTEEVIQKVEELKDVIEDKILEKNEGDINKNNEIKH